MIMFGIAFYEMDKAYRAGKKTAKRLQDAMDDSDRYKVQLSVAKTDLNRIKTL